MDEGKYKSLLNAYIFNYNIFSVANLFSKIKSILKLQQKLTKNDDFVYKNRKLTSNPLLKAKLHLFYHKT